MGVWLTLGNGYVFIDGQNGRIAGVVIQMEGIPVLVFETVGCGTVGRHIDRDVVLIHPVQQIPELTIAVPGIVVDAQLVDERQCLNHCARDVTRFWTR